MEINGIQLEPLEPLNLIKCRTVSDLLFGYERCSFGSRMAGEVTRTLHYWIEQSTKPVIIYDGRINTRLIFLLRALAEKGWFSAIYTSEEYASSSVKGGGNALVIGYYSERFEDALYEKAGRAIYINQFERVKPGQVRDGYFPDVVFADPDLILPMLYLALRERLDGVRATIHDLVKEFELCDATGKGVAHLVHTYKNMVRDRRCRRFFTISGAMTVAQMSLVICDMIDLEFTHSITATGALMAHGLVHSAGLKHYKYDPRLNDRVLAEHKLNRVTDTIEPEENFDHIEKILNRVFEEINPAEVSSPRLINEMVGKRLREEYPHDRGILRSAFEKRVPVFVPALIDSEISNDLIVHNERRLRKGIPRIVTDYEVDTKYRMQMKLEAEKIGIFTVGGGVPRNNDQNDAPLIEIMNERLGLEMPVKQFIYGGRIAPDALHFGGLGGCSYQEGGSWRKMDLVNGIFSEVRSDATIVWPICVKFTMEERETA